MNKRTRALLRAGGGRVMIDLDRVVIIRDGVMVHAPRIVDGAAVAAVENFCTSYGGDDLMHDIELMFPCLTYRDFFIGYRRFLTAERVLSGR